MTQAKEKVKKFSLKTLKLLQQVELKPWGCMQPLEDQFTPMPISLISPCKHGAMTVGSQTDGHKALGPALREVAPPRDIIVQFQSHKTKAEILETVWLCLEECAN